MDSVLSGFHLSPSAWEIYEMLKVLYLKVTWKMSPFDLEATLVFLILLNFVFINLLTYTGPWQQTLKFGGY